MNIVIAILIFTVIIVIHELGHFLLAKKNGVGVIEFSVGMGTRIITLAKTKEGIKTAFFISQENFENREDWQDVTKYSWKLFPIGGSCMMLGEDEANPSLDAFNNKGVWARISVIFAGPFFNFILAFVLSFIIIGIAGYDKPVIGQLEPGMPMEEAGFQVGEVIKEINGKNIVISRDISSVMQFQPLSGEPVEIISVRDGEEHTTLVTPVKDENGSYRLGFGYGGTYEKANPIELVKYSLTEVRYWIELTIKSLGQLITGKVSAKEISGPVGIVNMVGTAVDAGKSYGLLNVVAVILRMSILISANLGVMNLLPIPALDGGRLVFLLIEALRGKPVDREKEGMVHFAGLVVLMLFMVFVMYNDIARIL
ncbi:RIP metalloprotease RseP [Acetivibrio ethanolgignens]|uniref:Zinc metalloprotease n=1 Tax=Acetivibrio ethanolgignens TaxID=290052 RepID=A0A0V8QK94_9FIRM|nr:RIP metalloprotease RseP [Acetivibrio ethanolgignens]KSV60662.1 RIP metalloprotease RseP [Acetivibrio ethanolgignens]